jgi:cysteinyl-tRNA synthetase
MALKLYNTLTRQEEEFSPIDKKEVKMYTCGPTVYNYAHIGNLRAYVFADILRRSLEYTGFRVRQIMNITDIGHLSSDRDSGEDKMTKGLQREGKALTLENMREMAEFYTQKFNEDLKKLNIKMPTGMYFASDYVIEDIDLIKTLEEKGYTYKTSDGIYFDTSKDENYGELRGKKIDRENTESRLEENTEKKNPEDFALWKFPSSDKQKSQIGFDSPWSIGFPGWHIECSAMSMKFLGEQFDIHTGGVDHIFIHHTNEIAQSECATGKRPFVHFWLHSEFVDIGGVKMAKSEDNFLKLSTLAEKGIDPLAYRFWLLMASYRTKVNFSWGPLEAAGIALKRLYSLYLKISSDRVGEVNEKYQKKFQDCIENDLDTPRALSLLWDLFKDEKISSADKKETILDFDRVLGLGFKDQKEETIPNEVIKLAEERELARANKDFKKSDQLRTKINSLGYEIKDSFLSYTIKKI